MMRFGNNRKQAVTRLREMGLTVMMITGDNEKVAARVAEKTRYR